MNPTLTNPITADRDAFLNERLTCLGGSDAASLFSTGYGCQRRLFYQKRNVPADTADDDRPILRRGRKIEGLVLEELVLATGRRAEYVGLVRHPDHPEIAAHQDAVIYCDERPGPGTVEVKCLGRESYTKAKRTGMIEDYILQIQHGMLASGNQWGTFALFWPDGFELRYFDVERDDQLCELIRQTAVETWARIQDPTCELPERLDPHDSRCGTCRWQRTCQQERLLEIMDGGQNDADIPFDAQLAQLTAEYWEAKQVAAEAQDLADEAGNRLRAEILDRQAVDTSGFRIYYRVSERRTVDTKALKKDLPEVAEKYTKTSATRALRIYPRG